jgi:hypothetical protein
VVRPARSRRGRTGVRRLADYAGVLIAVAALLAFALGVFGYRAWVPGRRFSEYLYRSLQLFIIFVDPGGAPSPTEMPIALDVARFLAPAAATAAGIRAVLGLFGRRAARFWVRYFARDHVVVCGLGSLGSRLALAFLGAGHRVVGVGTPVAGVLVVAGDATDPDVLRTVGIGRARYLLVASEDDAWNADVALAARHAVAHRRRGLPCFVHIAQPGLADLLAEAALGAAAGPLRLEFFNTWESVPPMVLDEFPPGDHLLVAGGGRLARALIVHAARRWSEAGTGRRLQVSLVGDGAAATAQDLRARYPRLDVVCDVHLPADPPAGATSAYVAGEDDAALLRSALRISRAMPQVNTVMLTTERSGLATLMSGIADESASLFLVDVLERISRPDIVLHGTIERLARAIHGAYVRDQLAAGHTAANNPSLREWAGLTESAKESNRAQADALGTTLAAVGCRIQAWTDWTGEGVSFTPEEIERMAVLEHERWSRERRAEGWTVGPTRDHERKVTPYLVAWDELPDDVKDYNRNAVRALPELLTFAGFEIVRAP